MHWLGFVPLRKPNQRLYSLKRDRIVESLHPAPNPPHQPSFDALLFHSGRVDTTLSAYYNIHVILRKTPVSLYTANAKVTLAPADTSTFIYFQF